VQEDEILYMAAASRDTCAEGSAPGRRNRILFDRLVGIWGTVSCCSAAATATKCSFYRHHCRSNRALPRSRGYGVSGNRCKRVPVYITDILSLLLLLLLFYNSIRKGASCKRWLYHDDDDDDDDDRGDPYYQRTLPRRPTYIYMYLPK